MTYDAADRLTGIDAAGSANDATFSVDALGRFRTRVVNGTTDTYSYVGTSEVVARIATGAGTLDSITTTGGDRLGIRSGGTLNYLVPDPHGNVAGSLSADEATIVNAIRYDAYGETIATGSAGGSAVGAGAWTYQGRLDVSPSGLASPLLDMSARFYAPAIGAFTSLDSVMGSAQNPLSMNRYLYAHANPATLIDPTGHYAMEFEYGSAANPSSVGRELNLSCRSRGDYGCGATAATRGSSRRLPHESRGSCPAIPVGSTATVGRKRDSARWRGIKPLAGACVWSANAPTTTTSGAVSVMGSGIARLDLRVRSGTTVSSWRPISTSCPRSARERLAA